MFKIKEIINQCLKENPCNVNIFFDESMKEHTTFKVGGKADCIINPSFAASGGAASSGAAISSGAASSGFPLFCINLLKRTNEVQIPVFILGGGANIVVSDKGIRGIVIDMSGWKDDDKEILCTYSELKRGEVSGMGEEIIFKSGTKIDDAVNIAGAASFSGFEFLAGMPGTIGGAVWMNARCYGSEIADVLNWAQIIIKENNRYIIKKIDVDKNDFGYKQSPFQKMDFIILSAAFKLIKSDKEKILLEMDKNRKDRIKKRHYDFPCAGSVFKNNKDFGKPTGQIIDELGLKGLQIGGAQVAPFHGNIIINTGNATASDIRALTEYVAKRVKEAAGFELDPEILFVGEM